MHVLRYIAIVIYMLHLLHAKHALNTCFLYILLYIKPYTCRCMVSTMFNNYTYISYSRPVVLSRAKAFLFLVTVTAFDLLYYDIPMWSKLDRVLGFHKHSFIFLRESVLATLAMKCAFLWLGINQPHQRFRLALFRRCTHLHGKCICFHNGVHLLVPPAANFISEHGDTRSKD